MTIVLPKGENWKVYMSTKNDSHVRYYWWFMINAKWDHMVNWIQKQPSYWWFYQKSKITTALLLDNLDTTGYTDNVDTGVTALDQALEAKFMELHQTADWYTSKYMFWWLNKYQYDASNDHIFIHLNYPYMILYPDGVGMVMQCGEVVQLILIQVIGEYQY